MNAGLTSLSIQSATIDGQRPTTFYVGTNRGSFAMTTTPRFLLTIAKMGDGGWHRDIESLRHRLRLRLLGALRAGTTVTLRAAPSGGSVFNAWSGCDAVSEDETARSQWIEPEQSRRPLTVSNSTSRRAVRYRKRHHHVEPGRDRLRHRLPPNGSRLGPPSR